MIEELESYGLGMLRSEVKLVEHDPRWAQGFKFMDGLLTELTAGSTARFHHIGSTAIPGIKAKPILDVLCEIDSLEAFDVMKEEFDAAGIVCKGEYGIPGRRYCVVYDAAGTKGYLHLHAFQRGNPQIQLHLLFSTWLRKHPEKAREYEALKVELAERFANDRDKYSPAKNDWIQNALKEALAFRRKT